MPIDYRYHIGSFIAIFLALLLGILIGIGLAPDPEGLKKTVGELKHDFMMDQHERETLTAEEKQYESLSKEAVTGLIRDRLKGRRVAIILNHEFNHDPLPDVLRALMKESGATLASTTTITKEFVAMPESLRQRASERYSLVPSPGVHFRSLVAEQLGRDLAEGERIRSRSCIHWESSSRARTRTIGCRWTLSCS